MNKYFIVKSKTLAMGIQYITGQHYMVFNLDDSTKNYSFERTPNIEKAYNIIQTTKTEMVTCQE